MKQKNKQGREISLIVPAHNSSSVIKGSIAAYSRFLSGFCKKYEIIVVCNACKDDTAQKAMQVEKKGKHVRIIEIKERGKGFAVLKGFATAKYSIIGFMDADNAFNLNAVKNMICLLDKSDCVIASKWMGKNIFEVLEPFTRKMLAVGWRMLSFILLGLNFYDTQAGCKFLRRKAFLSIENKFICTGFDFDVELLFKLKRKEYSIKEVYVPTTKAFKFSTFRLRFVPGMFWHLFKLWVHTI
jgi:glycosyltransferase involved in cell wall biosynthesis